MWESENRKKNAQKGTEMLKVEIEHWGKK
jgi:hypothetical protein